jgi:hypothetical protein
VEEEVVDQEEEEPHGAHLDDEEMEEVSGDAAQDHGDQPNGICQANCQLKGAALRKRLHNK